MSVYPYQMVPYKGLKKEISVDILCENDFFIARRVDKDCIKKCGPKNIIPLDSSCVENLFKNVPNMSTTLLVDKDFVEFAKFSQGKRGRINWDGENVQSINYHGEAEKKNACDLVIYNGKNLHKQPVNFQKYFSKPRDAKDVDTFLSDEDRDLLKKGKFECAESHNIDGCIELKHSATMLNYWHFELNLKNASNEKIKKLNKSLDDVKDKKTTELPVKESFALFVLNNYLLKNFLCVLPDTFSPVPCDVFFDDSVTETVRNENAEKTKLAFEDDQSVCN